MKIEGLLPIGSVVLLKDSTHRVMVIGYYQKLVGNENKLYDYAGCLYPEGYVSADKNLLFDHAQIDRVYAVGYMDDAQHAFMEVLDEAIKEYESGER